MKRFKYSALVCNKEENPIELLDIIDKVSNENGYKVERYTSFEENDSLAVYIKENSLPYSRLILKLNNKKNSVDIINIIPNKESGISSIGYTEYNKLLEIYRNNVFVKIKEKYGNAIEENTEDYCIKDIIPLSYEYLQTWLNNYPLSGHPQDTARWNDFVIKLHLNGEHLPVDDFCKYLEEDYNWNEDDVSKFSLELESHINLLKHYDDLLKTIKQ